MTDPDVTIYIITYNYGHFLAGAIESALAQDVPVRVAVVDDGSTDSSRDVAMSFGSSIEYIWKPNGGLSDARNHALSLCTTPFLLFLDADDRLPRNFIRITREALKEHGQTAFAYIQLAYFVSDTELSEAEISTEFPPFSIARLKRSNYINAAALMRRDAIGLLRYDTRLRHGLEDWEFFIQLTRAGYVGIRVDGTALYYRRHPSSMGQELQRRTTARRLTYLRIFVKHWRFFGLKDLWGFVQRSAAYRMTTIYPGRRGTVMEGPDSVTGPSEAEA